jgi:putative nucleotidyltransferase with HDIG domain
LNQAKGVLIPVDQLKVGMYVHLSAKWFEHPFPFSHFKIHSEDQIASIRGLGLTSVFYNPALSAPYVEPPRNSSSVSAHAVQDQTVAPKDQVQSSITLAKQAMIEQMRQRRANTKRVEGDFIQMASTIRDIEKNIYSNPTATCRQANNLVKNVVDSILTAPELAIHLMGERLGSDELYFHSLNVTVISLMIAREIKLPSEVAASLGLGALMHDIGLKEVPDKVLLKQSSLTQAERNFYELHCEYGVALGRRLQFSPAVLAIIAQHHELSDGSGYPSKLKGDAIDLLARIVVIANFYDELCNANNMTDAMTPHEALSLMFAKLRNKFDAKLLQALIRCLGVYPPGTIVQLSNGEIGMVCTVNTTNPTKPTLVIYDAGVPKEEAIFLNMEMQNDINIAKALRAAQLPKDVYNYLSPRKRVIYFFDNAEPKTGVH